MKTKPQTRYAIRKIWNDPKHIEALAATVPDGYAIRRRARGYRFGQVRYHQSMPLELCAYFTQYHEPKGVKWCDRTSAWHHIYQFEFRGFTDSGKPIIRFEG